MSDDPQAQVWPPAPGSVGGGFWRPCYALWRREITGFLRQRSRIAGALGTPLVFWLLAGAGLGQSFRMPVASDDTSYLEFSFTGALAAILLFTAIFSTITIIDDRRQGFLQGVLVAPVSRITIVLGIISGASTLAVGHALVFCLLAPFVGIAVGIKSVAATLGALVLLAFALSSLGFLVAWHMRSTQGFHAIMNLILVPMLILSGAFFPVDGAAAWLRATVMVNPLAYGVSVLRSAVHAETLTRASEGPAGLGVCLVVSLVFAGALFALAAWVAARETRQVFE